MPDLATSPGGRPMDTSPLGNGKNWLTPVGGLPTYMRGVAHALIRRGMPEQRAVAIAVQMMHKWARGGGHVHQAVQAGAAAALTEWNAKRAASHTSLTGQPADVVDLGFNPAQPRASSGQWTSGQSGSAATGPTGGYGAQTRADIAAFQKAVGLSQTGTFTPATVNLMLHPPKMSSAKTKTAAAKLKRAAKGHATALRRAKTAQARSARHQAAVARAAARARARAAVKARRQQAAAARHAASAQHRAAAHTQRQAAAATRTQQRAAVRQAVAQHRAARTVAHVNSLSPKARATWQASHGLPPGYHWQGSTLVHLAGTPGRALDLALAPMNASTDGMRVTVNATTNIGPAGLTGNALNIYQRLIAKGLKPNVARAFATRAAAKQTAAVRTDNTKVQDSTQPAASRLDLAAPALTGMAAGVYKKLIAKGLKPNVARAFALRAAAMHAKAGT